MSSSVLHRRSRMASALLASGGIAAASLLAGCGTSSDDPSSAPSTAPSPVASSTTTPAPSTAPSTASTSKPTESTTTQPAGSRTAVLGPAGFGKLRLGTTRKQAEATGQLMPKGNPTDGACLGST
jgi:cell division septation protein DedD